MGDELERAIKIAEFMKEENEAIRDKLQAHS
jgi:hypothetical protein